MGAWAWVIWGAAGLGALLGLVAAGALLAIAFTGRRGQRRFSDLGHPIGGCDCCGYDLAGLEDGLCPECGWTYDASRRLPWGKRFRIAGAAAAALLLAGASLVLPAAARGGALSIVPDALLIGFLPLGPAVGLDNGAVRNELRNRIDTARIVGWERDLLASMSLITLRITADNDGAAACRDAVAAMLARVSDDGHVQASSVLNLLEDRAGPVRQRAAEGLGRIARSTQGPDRETAIQRLLGMAVCDRDPQVRRQAIATLADLPAPGRHAAGVLARAVRDPAPQVRARAMYALYSDGMAPDDDRPLIMAAQGARDADARVREAANYALWRLSDRYDGAVLILGFSLCDGSVEVRRSGAEMLARLGNRAAPAWSSLLAGLHDHDPAVLSSVAEALRGLGS